LIDLAKNQKYGPRIKNLELCLVTFADFTKCTIEGSPRTKAEINQYEDIAVQEDINVESELSELDQLIQSAKDGSERQEIFRKHLKRRRRRNYGRHQVDQYTMRKQGIDMDMLVEALQNLPSLESIGLVDVLDQTSPPWGARKLREDIGIWPGTAFRRRTDTYYDYYTLREDERRSYLSFLSHALALTFGAIVKSGVKLKRSFAVNGALYDFALPKKPSSRRLRPTGTPAKVFCEERIPELVPAYAELKELSIHSYSYHRNDLAMVGHENPFDWITTYIPIWSSIESLSVKGAGLEREPHALKIFSSSSDVFPRLQHLKLESLPFHIGNFKALLAHHSGTLKTLSIKNCRLLGGNFCNLIRETESSPALVSLELIGDEKNPRFGFIWNTPAGLDGINHKRLGIRGKTPAEYQEKIEGALKALNFGHTDDVLQFSEEF
jgi:hypothetical protein